MVERTGAGRVERVAVHCCGGDLAHMGFGLWRGDRLRRILCRVRIHPLVHAFAQEAACGAIRDFLPAERPPSSASPLHEPQFQRGSASGGCRVGHNDFAVEDPLQTSDRPHGPERPAENKADADGGNDVSFTSRLC